MNKTYSIVAQNGAILIITENGGMILDYKKIGRFRIFKRITKTLNCWKTKYGSFIEIAKCSRKL